MPTSASCLPARQSKRSTPVAQPGAPRARGFTLLEILVVLAIAGLLAAVVLPQLANLAASVEIANQRKDLQIAVENLGYQAYVTGKPIILEGTHPAKAPEAAAAPPLPVPSGWRIDVPRPLRYSVNGVCSGGTISLTSPDGVRESFTLKAPKCRLELAGKAP